MTDIAVGLGTLANFTIALESIGFTADTTDNSKFWWDNDTSKHFYLRMETSGSNLVPKMYYPNGTCMNNVSNISLATTQQAKISYELLQGGGIAIGFSPTTFTGSRIHFLICAPISQTDSWNVCCYNTNNMFNTETQTALTHQYGSVRGDDVSVIQIVKCHNGLAFADNIYYTTICKKIGVYSADNTLRATISGNLYLVVNLTGSETYGKWAVRIAS